MGKTIKFGLDTDSIQKAIQKLDKYSADTEIKCKRFVKKLYKIGIDAIQVSLGDYKPYIGFKKTIVVNNHVVILTLIAFNERKLFREWKNRASSGGYRVEEVNPILMAEFGSGMFADDIRGNAFGAGRGTFPNQKHAFDDNGWYWTTPDNVTHHSFGEEPEAPMLQAKQVMESEILNVAREVWK